MHKINSNCINFRLRNSNNVKITLLAKQAQHDHVSSEGITPGNLIQILELATMATGNNQ